jgi:hypothetical protein
VNLTPRLVGQAISISITRRRAPCIERWHQQDLSPRQSPAVRVQAP